MNYKQIKAIMTASLFVLCFEIYTHETMNYATFLKKIISENELSLDINNPNIKFLLEQLYHKTCLHDASSFYQKQEIAHLQSEVDKLTSDYNRDIESIKKPYEKLLVENEAIYDLYNRIKKKTLFSIKPIKQLLVT